MPINRTYNFRALLEKSFNQACKNLIVLLVVLVVLVPPEVAENKNFMAQMLKLLD
jgi:hypothetical protein